jgi:hypothetical protein
VEPALVGAIDVGLSDELLELRERVVRYSMLPVLTLSAPETPRGS